MGTRGRRRDGEGQAPNLRDPPEWMRIWPASVIYGSLVMLAAAAAIRWAFPASRIPSLIVAVVLVSWFAVAAALGFTAMIVAVRLERRSAPPGPGPLPRLRARPRRRAGPDPGAADLRDDWVDGPS